jgi:Leucine-rich repeat (LRR) protein
MNTQARRFHRLSRLILAMAILSAFTALPASGLDTGGTPFAPAPKTAYAEEFIEKCDGQQWFMDMAERALNISARSINTLQSRSDLTQIISLATNSPADGALPPAIGEFTQLRYLFLGGIGLTGEIPGELYKCTKLENLDLSGNALTGVISPDTEKLVSLKVLLLHGNNLSGSIPALPASLINLDLSDNGLTGGVPASVGALTQLKLLGLSNNPLGGTLPEALGSLTGLRILTAWNCGFAGAINPKIGTLSSLEILDLSQNAFTGGVPASFSGLSGLKKLALSDAGLAGAFPDTILSLTGLETLDLSDNDLTGALPNALSGFTSLKILDLDGNKLSGAIPDVFGAMTKLETAYLRGNQFTGDAPSSLITRQTAGADVRVDQNYLHGANTSKITHNAGNFTSDATQDYQVQLFLEAYTQLQKGAKLNVYGAFKIKRADNGNDVSKPKLPPAAYELVLKSALDDPDEYIAITSDPNGIYIELLKDVPYAEAIELELRMLPHDAGAPYTFVSFKLGTGSPDPASGVSTGVGGGTSSPEPTPTPSPTPKPEPEKPVRHEPYIAGLPGNLSAPDAPLTREQAAVILHRIAGEPYAKYDSQFPDVTKARWSSAAIAYMAEQGIMLGYPDGRFAPEDNITRAEFAALLVRYKGYEPARTEKFPDAADNWANGYIGAADLNGLMHGLPDGSFGPDRHISRAEVITAINRMLGRFPDEAAAARLPNPYKDLPETHWAYAQIIEATTAHDAVYENGVEVWE